MRPRELFELARKMIRARLPLLVKGAPGVGKSDIIAQAAAAEGADLILSHPVVSDPTDAKGLPWPSGDGKTATFLPFGELARALEASRPTVWFLDDLGQASPAVQASFMQLILARRVNGHALPDHVTFVAATNRREDRAGVSGILEPVKSRFAAIVELVPTVEDWTDWAIQAEQPAEVIAFLRLRSELLFEPPAKRAAQDIVNAPCPRTWARLGQLFALGLPQGLQFPAFAGAVGEGAATEFLAFLRLLQDAPSIDAILMDPHGAPIPDKPHALYAVASGLAHRANPKTFGAIAVYATRLHGAGFSEFAVLAVRDSQRKCPAVANTKDFIKLASGPLAEAIFEAVKEES